MPLMRMSIHNEPVSKLTALWPVTPLQTLIVDSLSRKNAALFDDELLNNLQITYGYLSDREFNKALMCLEIHGIIHVATVTRSKRHIELISRTDSDRSLIRTSAYVRRMT
jgi:hypothetical protein